MKNIILFDEENWDNLLPFTYTRPVSELRVGILTIREKWEKYLQGSASYITREYLSEKYPFQIEEDNIIIFSSLLPNPEIVDVIINLTPNEALIYGDRLLAARINKDELIKLQNNDPSSNLNGKEITKSECEISILAYPEDIFLLNDQELRLDYNLMTAGRTSQSLSATNTVLGDQVFVEEGAEVECAILNSKDAPIYIGKGAKILEGSMIRHGLALCSGAVIKMGAKIYGATTLGPGCKVGGELKNAVMYANSNKGHDGYLGNSVIGEWCNLGAGTNTSNLKNNYSAVRLWDYSQQGFRKTGQMFCGLMMGDHSKCGIDMMFNTGTMIGVSANIFGSGYPRNFIPSFAWGGASGFQTNHIKKAMQVAKVVLPRRNQELTEADEKILQYIFYKTSHYRTWEK